MRTLAGHRRSLAIGVGVGVDIGIGLGIGIGIGLVLVLLLSSLFIINVVIMINSSSSSSSMGIVCNYDCLHNYMNTCIAYVTFISAALPCVCRQCLACFDASAWFLETLCVLHHDVI